MGAAASTASVGTGLGTANLEDYEQQTVEELCTWIRTQSAGAIGEELAKKCAASGLSVAELLLHMDQETLLPTLQLTLSDDAERKQVRDVLLAGRCALRREYAVPLKELPDAMDRAVYVLERFPLVLDPSGQATRFLKYQRSAILMATNPSDMTAESLRRHLVGAIRHGTWLVLDFDIVETLELEQFFAPDAFPREILSRQALFAPAVITRLLRPEDGDPEPDQFLVNDQFKFVVLCRGSQPPPKTALAMCVLRVYVGDERAASSSSPSSSEDGTDAFARAIGVAKEMTRNSLELVEAAFDNDMDGVVKCLDQNYDLESADGHGHTALSEAACQGNVALVRFLLERRADPNKLSDEKRSALSRAAYNGHLETVELLLASGGDPRHASSQSETAFDVAKTQEIRDCLQGWDLSRTDALLDARRKLIEQKWQERITTHVERERFALMKVHEELQELARSGDAEALEARLEQLVEEAIDLGDKPRASADIRDERGSTLLAIAAQHDHLELVTLLTTKWKVWHELAQQTALATGLMQKELMRKQEQMAKALKANVNARDCRGWTPVAIAVFHGSKRSLRVLLANGGDPRLKNQYNKNAFDFAKDDIDAALNVVKSRAEIRQVLDDWEHEGMQSIDSIKTTLKLVECVQANPEKETVKKNRRTATGVVSKGSKKDSSTNPKGKSGSKPKGKPPSKR